MLDVFIAIAHVQCLYPDFTADTAPSGCEKNLNIPIKFLLLGEQTGEISGNLDQWPVATSVYFWNFKKST